MAFLKQNLKLSMLFRRFVIAGDKAQGCGTLLGCDHGASQPQNATVFFSEKKLCNIPFIS